LTAASRPEQDEVERLREQNQTLQESRQTTNEELIRFRSENEALRIQIDHLRMRSDHKTNDETEVKRGESGQVEVMMMLLLAAFGREITTTRLFRASP
jgi:regulator of replication initiation timing